MAVGPNNDLLVATHVSPEMRETIRAEAKARNIPMSRLVARDVRRTFEVKERKRKPRAFSADLPKMDQTALNLDADAKPAEDAA